MIKYDIEFDKEVVIESAHPKGWADKVGLSPEQKSKIVKMIFDNHYDIAYAFTVFEKDYSNLDAYGCPEILEITSVYALTYDW